MISLQAQGYNGYWGDYLRRCEIKKTSQRQHTHILGATAGTINSRILVSLPWLWRAARAGGLMIGMHATGQLH